MCQGWLCFGFQTPNVQCHSVQLLFSPLNLRGAVLPKYVVYFSVQVQYPVKTAQLVARQTGTTEVVGSNPGKGEDFSDPNLNCIKPFIQSKHHVQPASLDWTAQGNLRRCNRSKKLSKIHRYRSNNRLRKNQFMYVNRIDYIIDSLSKYRN